MRDTMPLLSPATYAVLQKVPNDWMHLQTVKEEICRATDQPAGAVARRLAHLTRKKLLEQRPAVDGPEVRRCAW